MLDLEKELKSTGIPFKNLYWVKSPQYPYGVFDDVTLFRGNDERLTLAEHETRLELYAEKVDEDSEDKIEEWLKNKNFAFKRTRYWVDSEKHFQTIYEFSFVEKL